MGIIQLLFGLQYTKTTLVLGHWRTWNQDDSLLVPSTMPSNFIGSEASLFPMGHILSRWSRFLQTCNEPTFLPKASRRSSSERFGNNCVVGEKKIFCSFFFPLSFVVVVTMTCLSICCHFSFRSFALILSDSSDKLRLRGSVKEHTGTFA
jgi:hypothetical protein